MGLKYCGSTIFNALVVSTKPQASTREKYEGKKNNFNELDLLNSLTKICFPRFETASNESVKKLTTRYKKGVISSSKVYFPLDNDLLIQELQKEYDSNYTDIKKRTVAFVNAFIDESEIKRKTLIKIIMTAIKNDPAAPSQICYKGSKLPKSSFLAIKEFELSDFLCSTWLTVILNKIQNVEIEFKMANYLDKRFDNIKIKEENTIDEHSEERKIKEPIDEIKEPIAEEPQTQPHQTIHTNIYIGTNNGSVVYNDYGRGQIASSGKRDHSHYNLFVLDGEDLSRYYFEIKRDKALTFKPDKSDNDKFRFIGDDEISKLKEFPCIFLNKNRYAKKSEGQKAIFGYITDIVNLDDGYKITYDRRGDFDQDILNKNCSVLSLISCDGENELDIVHWTVKAANLTEVLKGLGVDLLS